MISKDLLTELKNENEQAFHVLFSSYYVDLVTFANSIVKDFVIAEDIVQSFFIKFWQEKLFNNINSSMDSYLFRAVKNSCLNHIRDEKRKNLKLGEMLKEAEKECGLDIEDDYGEKENIYRAIYNLPLQCKRIFILCCVHNMKYQDVADHLNISVNTVRTQMGRAFKSLRKNIIRKVIPFILFNAFSLLKTYCG